MKKRSILLASVLGLWSVSSIAADSGLYFDVSLGQSTANDIKKADFVPAANFYLGSIDSSKFDDTASYWSAAVGFKILRYLSADISWVDLGDTKYRATGPVGTTDFQYKGRVSSTGPTLAANGILPLGRRFELQGRVGVMFAKTTSTAYLTDFIESATGSASAKSTNPLVGVGAAVNFTETFAIRVSAQRFMNVGDTDEIGSKTDIDVFSFGMTFSQ